MNGEALLKDLEALAKAASAVELTPEQIEARSNRLAKVGARRSNRRLGGGKR